MTTKEYFSQVFYLDKMISAKIEQCKRLKELAAYVSPVISADKVMSGSMGGPGHGQEYICNWLDLESEIRSGIDELLCLKKEIEDVINAIDEPRYRLLLTLRYLNYKKLEEIANIMNYSYRSVQYIHNNALNCGDKILLDSKATKQPNS